MLSPASWLHYAKDLPIGAKTRVDHDCGGGRTMTVSSSSEGLSAFCFRCNDNGWSPPTPVPLAERLERLKRMQYADNAIAEQVAPPEPRTTAWADWPPACRLWLLKAGLCSADLPGLGAYYHAPSDRVVLVVSDPFLRPLFWQARAVDRRLPKYMAPPVDKSQIVPVYGRADVVTLTEDILSAYKVGLEGEGWSLMGTSLNKETARRLILRGCKVNVWLDPDPPGRRAAKKVMASLRSLGIECRDILSKTDPKLVHRADIKELITWTHS